MDRVAPAVSLGVAAWMWSVPLARLAVLHAAVVWRNPKSFEAYTRERQDSVRVVAPDAVLPTHDQFYAEYHGHRVDHLAGLRSHLVDSGCRRFVYLCGDSSLDNKAWVPSIAQAAPMNGYPENWLMMPDVCYHINVVAQLKSGESGAVCAINCAVEESSLESRRVALLQQDEFVRDHLESSDVIVMSVGGNDVVLNPSLRTVVNAALVALSPTALVRSEWAPGLGYFCRFVAGGVDSYAKRLKRECPAANVLVCMIYFPLEEPGGSWADSALKLIGYDRNPQKLQAAIRAIYRHLQHFTFESGNVTLVPLFEALDGKNAEHYCARVEPNDEGGRVLAEFIMKYVTGV